MTQKFKNDICTAIAGGLGGFCVWLVIRKRAKRTDANKK